jgi:hypothetical protein
MINELKQNEYRHALIELQAKLVREIADSYSDLANAKDELADLLKPLPGEMGSEILSAIRGRETGG